MSEKELQKRPELVAAQFDPPGKTGLVTHTVSTQISTQHMTTEAAAVHRHVADCNVKIATENARATIVPARQQTVQIGLLSVAIIGGGCLMHGMGISDALAIAAMGALSGIVALVKIVGRPGAKAAKAE